MKLLLTLTMLSSLTASTIAQTNYDYLPKYYGQLGTGPSTHNGAFAEFAGTVVFKSRLTATIAYQNFDMTPSNLPSDYEQGYDIILPFPIPDEMPTNLMKSINFMAGRYFSLGRKTWITGEGGLSITSGDKFTFTPQSVENSGSHFSSNYAVGHENKTGAGAIVKVDFNWAIVPYAGLSVGAFANVNSVQSPIGLQFKLIAGWLNTKRKIS